MNAIDADRAATTQRWPTAALVGIVLLRIAIGWHFLYEGLTKLLDPAWTAAGYLRSSQWLLADTFRWMAETPPVLTWVNLLNVWGLMLIGIALMLGIFTRAASLAGILLLALYYVAHPPLVGVEQAIAEGSYLIVNKNVVEMIALLVLAIAPPSGFAGLGRYVAAGYRRLSGTVRRAASSGETPPHVDPEGLSRREILTSLATLPVLGGFVYAFLQKRAFASAGRDNAPDTAGVGENGCDYSAQRHDPRGPVAGRFEGTGAACQAGAPRHFPIDYGWELDERLRPCPRLDVRVSAGQSVSYRRQGSGNALARPAVRDQRTDHQYASRRPVCRGLQPA